MSALILLVVATTMHPADRRERKIDGIRWMIKRAPIPRLEDL